MVEFPLLVPQIWRSRKPVATQIHLMNIHVSECKYYCDINLVPKFCDVPDRQNWRLHPTDERCIVNFLHGSSLYYEMGGEQSVNQNWSLKIVID